MTTTNVLHLIDTTGPGGAESVYVDIASGLDPARFKSIVTTDTPDSRDRTHEGISARGWLFDTLTARGVTPVIAPTTRAFDAAFLMRLARICRAQRVDVIHSHLLTSSVYASVIGRLLRIPVVSTFHGVMDVSTPTRQTRIKIGLLNRLVSRAVFVSEYLRLELASSVGLRGQSSSVIHNGIDTTRFQPGPHSRLRERLGVSRAHTLIGAVGNVRPAKAYDVLLASAAEMLRAGILFHIVIAGDGEGELWETLMRQRAELRLEEHVSFVGFQHDVPDFLTGLDVYVLPSTTEGFSLAVVEAMACGLAIVGTRSGGPQEIIRDNESGLLVATSDAADLARALTRVAIDLPLRNRLGATARERAVSAFSTGTMIRQYERLYDSISESAV